MLNCWVACHTEAGIAIGGENGRVIRQNEGLTLDVHFRPIAFSLLTGFAVSSAHAADYDYEVDFQSSQAILRAIEACRADKCDLSTYRLSTRRVGDGTEVILLGKEISAEQLFAGDYDDVLERHYLIDASGKTLIRRWFGK
jgi:hypothetical protein